MESIYSHAAKPSCVILPFERLQKVFQVGHLGAVKSLRASSYGDINANLSGFSHGNDKVETPMVHWSCRLT